MIQKAKPKITINVDKDFFNPVYLPLLNNKHRFTLLYGGAGSGKSHFAVQKMILKALKYPNRKILVVRKVQNTIRNSIFALFMEQLEAMNLKQHVNATTANMKIDLPNGSQFLFVGMDDPEKIKSIASIDDIVIEEATDLTIDDFSQLNLRLRSNAENQQIHLMFNPVSKTNWVYKYFFVQEQPNTIILKTTYKDNRFLPQSYIDTLEDYKKNNPMYYTIYALGNFGSLGKKVFENWKAEDFDVKQLIKSNQDLVTCIGLDFGFTNDPTTIMFSLADFKNKKLYVVQETYEKGLLNNEIADIIIDNNYYKQVIFADSAEPKSIEELKRLGIRKITGVKKGAGSINQGIQYMKQFEIIIHTSCKNTIAEFKDYSFKKDKITGEYLNEFTGADHCIDAIRYSLNRYRERR